MFDASRVLFVTTAVQESLRLDKRELLETRPIAISFRDVFGTVEVSFGETQVVCVVSGEIVTPYHDRPNEGFLSFHVDLSGVDGFHVYSSDDPSSLAMRIEATLKGSRAIDCEALCILGGNSVWSIRVDLHVINDDGNVCDALCLASLAGLSHYRHQDYDAVGQDVILHSKDNRRPVPLNVHHTPILITVGVYRKSADGDLIFLVDPSSLEEKACTSSVSVAINQLGELCGLHKMGSEPMTFEEIAAVVGLVRSIAQDFVKLVFGALENDEKKRELQRKNVAQRYELAPQ